MSNRLEELSSKYNKYRLKQFSKFMGVTLLIISSALVPYFILKNKTVVDESPIILLTKVSIGQAPTYRAEVNVEELNILANEKSSKKKFHKKTKKNKPSTSYFKQTNTKPDIKSSDYFTDLGEVKSLDVWIEKYNKSKSYGSAMHISKVYFKDANYKQAGIWAKRANQLNRDREEAWLYYAKSVHSLGNHPKAKRILSIYLQHKKSIKAELLLSEWNS